MSTNIANKSPYLISSRQFSTDAEGISLELNKAYVDIANNVNSRTIGIFATNSPVVNGENWFTAGGNQKQQAFRQVYLVTGTGTIAHGIDTTNIGGFVRIYGTFTDNTLWYPLPYVDITSSTNQVLISVDATNINITAGGGAPPTVSSGFVVLEWISS